MKSKDINFEYIEEFVDYVIDEVENNEDNFVTVIAKFDEAKEILKNAMTYDDVNFESLQIESPIMDNYCDEFALSFWTNDGVLEIGCEKLKRNGEYIDPSGDVVFLFDNCSSKIIPLCEDSKLYFISIEGECDCDKECDCGCERCDCDGNDIHGFTVDNETNNGYSKFTYYSSSPVDKTDIRNILREFGF